MDSLDLRTLLSLFAAALCFGCAPAGSTAYNGPDLPTEDDDDDDDDDDDPVTDAYESNQDIGSAYPLPMGAHSGLTFCEGDTEDWFALELRAGDYISAEATFIHAEGDVDLKLYDATEFDLAGSTSVSDSESVGAAIETDGTYFVRVYLYGDNGEPGQSYELTVDVGEAPVEEPPAPCPTDAFEGNDEANPMALTVGTYTDLVVCDDIDDWYSITLAEGQELTITAMFLDDEGDIDVRVFAPDGAYVTAGTSVSDDEVVTLTAETAGTYAVRVYLFADAAGTDEGNMYDLDILF